jgi:hypothetical protein
VMEKKKGNFTTHPNYTAYLVPSWNNLVLGTPLTLHCLSNWEFYYTLSYIACF